MAGLADEEGVFGHGVGIRYDLMDRMGKRAPKTSAMRREYENHH